MTASLLRRYESAQDAMLRATMPQSGIVEYTDLIPRVPLTRRVWRAGIVTQLSKADHDRLMEVR